MNGFEHKGWLVAAEGQWRLCLSVAINFAVRAPGAQLSKPLGQPHVSCMYCLRC